MLLVSEKHQFISFRTLMWIGTTVILFSLILQIVFPRAALMSWFLFLFCVVLGISLRLHITQRENMNSNFILECCVGLWCHWCSVAQSKFSRSFCFPADRPSGPAHLRLPEGAGRRRRHRTARPICPRPGNKLGLKPLPVQRLICKEIGKFE